MNDGSIMGGVAMDTDTIGLIVLLIALVALLIAAKVSPPPGIGPGDSGKPVGEPGR